MEQHDPTLAFARVHILDLCPRKALCLRSMFHLLCQLTSYGLGTSPSYTQVAPLLVFCIELMVALAPTIPRVSPPLSLISISTPSVPPFELLWVAPPLDLAMHPPMHSLKRDHTTTPRRSLGPLSFVELLFLRYYSSICAVCCT